ncbi:MAG: TIGR03085 family metal-binding protein [Microthrixaceae bacterium]
MSSHNFAQDERSLLCDLLEQLGPDAPTLCEGWTTKDLAAHLYVREQRPDAAIGIVAPPFAGYSERIRREVADRDFEKLVSQVRSGPPRVSVFALPGIDRLANTMEYFIHHEDVLRAQTDNTPRTLAQGLQLDLWNVLRKMSKLLLRKAPVGAELVCPELGSVVACSKHPAVVLTASVSELAVFCYGRQGAANVAFSGADSDVESLCLAKFSI